MVGGGQGEAKGESAQHTPQGDAAPPTPAGRGTAAGRLLTSASCAMPSASHRSPGACGESRGRYLGREGPGNCVKHETRHTCAPLALQRPSIPPRCCTDGYHAPGHSLGEVMPPAGWRRVAPASHPSLPSPCDSPMLTTRAKAPPPPLDKRDRSRRCGRLCKERWKARSKGGGPPDQVKSPRPPSLPAGSLCQNKSKRMSLLCDGSDSECMKYNTLELGTNSILRRFQVTCRGLHSARSFVQPCRGR